MLDSQSESAGNHGSTPKVGDSVSIWVEVGVSAALSDDAQAVVFKVAEAICSSLNKLHFAMEALGDGVGSADSAPHADARLLLENGIATVSALAMTERTVSNRTIRASFSAARLKIVEGMPISAAFGSTGFFPPLVIDIMTVGDNTGNIVPSLQEVARYYAERQTRQINTFMGVVSVGVLMLAFAFVAMIAFGIISSVFGLSASLRAG